MEWLAVGIMVLVLFIGAASEEQERKEEREKLVSEIKSSLKN